ncbi:transcriptional regulator, ArsR family [Pseudooceanicola antarcticus]|uniref:Transcriptional regulator n=1 Tax=Pseudooceanicola antarcticus TaxID=1247613 RepID=A0A285J7H9_9RHOB|nr:metalloregulator ArsR/SmtB family transcription factor [Pseudooceanicola antarcticus]PJE27036.1 transcriptional regulator [Pseudooceanicola antarcticus]SNY56234.1 transcriptional regulator, ArsR family [Pseudooceanicola antarcticus]
MPNQTHELERTFSALSDPTRRAVVQALCEGPATVSQLAAPFAMALPSFTQHLGVLEEAGLITSRRQGRSRLCALNGPALREAEDWLAAHRRQWEARLDRLEAHLETMKKEQSDDQ